MAAKRSTKRCVGARVPWACSTAWMMRASTVSLAGAVTSYSSAPCWLMVPANTSSPGAFSTGTLSPVMGAWSMALWPAVTRPSSASRSPGRTRTTAPRAMVSARCSRQLPSGWRASAMGGVSASRPPMAWRARSTARASISSAIEYSAITMAASAHWPIRKAPVTATVISAEMPSWPRASAARPLR